MACVCSYVSGHITLTFPPARKYAFDFMDNIRTRGPCGVPKGNTHTDQFHYPHEEGKKKKRQHPLVYIRVFKSKDKF